MKSKLLFAGFVCMVLLTTQSSYAWEYNLSRILMPLDKWSHPTMPYCPPSSFYGTYTCKGDATDNSRNSTSFSSLNDTAYKYSCYYQAFSFVKDAPNPIQPLTSDLSVIKKAIGGDGGSDPIYDARSGITEEKLKQIVNVGMRPYQKNIWPIQYFNSVGANTSAMQGLLWSWRSVSKNWEGIWSSRSDYEDSGDSSATRSALPSPKNSKHIIIVSDGNDSDGVQNYEFRNYNGDFNDGLPEGDFNRLVGNLPIDNKIHQPASLPMSKGIKKYQDDWGVMYPEHPSGNKIGDITSPFDICDAHIPQDSIPLRRGAGVAEDSSYARGLPYRIDQEGYEEVCEAIAAQGIKVHTVLYGYAGNDKLTNCSEITGGLSFKDVNPDELEDKLKHIFLSAAKTGIKLIK